MRLPSARKKTARSRSDCLQLTDMEFGKPRRRLDSFLYGLLAQRMGS